MLSPRIAHNAQAMPLPFLWPLTSPGCIQGDPVAAVRTIGRQDRLRGAGCPGTTGESYETLSPFPE